MSTARPATSIDDPVARAEQALAQLSSEFSSWMDTECERLDARRQQVKANGFNKKTHDALFHAAHDIKGEAATFGFPWSRRSADSLCRLIEHTPDMHRIPLDAGRSACRRDPRHHPRERPAGYRRRSPTRSRERLREVTDEFLLHENRDRPDYLDGIWRRRSRRATRPYLD